MTSGGGVALPNVGTGRPGTETALLRALPPLRTSKIPSERLRESVLTEACGIRRVMWFTDKTLSCRDCAREFVFSANEQQQCASLGFRTEPQCCPACRTVRKTVEPKPGVLPRSRRGLGRVGTNLAVCSACGQETRVPFLPKGDRPVYCGDCFDRRRG